MTTTRTEPAINELERRLDELEPRVDALVALLVGFDGPGARHLVELIGQARAARTALRDAVCVIES